MPELPEVSNRAKEMNEALRGFTIQDIDITQPKSLNVPPEEFRKQLIGAQILEVTYHGKWIFTQTSQAWLLINLGMGGEILFSPCVDLPEKHRVIFRFTNDECLSINFWWFGYVHAVPLGELEGHSMTTKLGPNAVQLDAEGLSQILEGRRGRIKSILLDQSKIAGIGNAYVHDILYLAGLHPLRPANTLSKVEVHKLWASIQQGLRPSMAKGGAFYEVDLYGKPGRFSMDDVLIGYKEHQPCPNCNSEISKIKTGSTSSFICPTCQRL
jgi:formamidopyrimidine-DNA glycosylase